MIPKNLDHPANGEALLICSGLGVVCPVYACNTVRGHGPGHREGRRVIEEVGRSSAALHPPRGDWWRPWIAPNVDTDAIIPKAVSEVDPAHRLRSQSVRRMAISGSWRTGNGHSKRPLNPDFVLNKPRYQGAQILLARRISAAVPAASMPPGRCSTMAFVPSSRPSFADIFYNNCFKNGLLPIVLDAAVVDRLFRETEANEGYRLTIDLAAQTVTTPSGEVLHFEVDEFRKYCLLNGLDDIGLTLRHVDKIRAYEERRKKEAPWLFN
jgi:3-isopropylmalate/(R)-2-methylmalate dehydratase small subunit